MFFYVSLVLVIVAAVTLVIGLLSSGLPLVIISIVASFLAGVFLIVTVMRDRPRPQPAAAPPAQPAGGVREAPAATAAVEADEEVEELEFPIADYDELRVSEIVPLLPELDDDELEDVRAHEEAGKSRTTVLNRIDELLDMEVVEEEWEEEEVPEEELEFPIADYDELRVSEIVPLLPELDDDELEEVRAHEEAGKSRTTVLNRIDELLGVEEAAPAPAAASRGGGKAPAKKFPIANYDDLTVGDVAKRLKKLGDDELKQVRTYEKRNKARKGVLDRIDAELST